MAFFSSFHYVFVRSVKHNNWRATEKFTAPDKEFSFKVADLIVAPLNSRTDMEARQNSKDLVISSHI